jgi:hypothetical protein
MAVDDLAEGLATSETLVCVWHDDEGDDIFIQYGYVSISMPREDFHDLIEFLVQAEEQLERGA